MLPLSVLCDARKLCCMKPCRCLNQRDLKLHYLTSADIAQKLQYGYWYGKERLIINILKHRYTSAIDVRDAVYSEYDKVIVYLIQTKRINIGSFYKGMDYLMNDSALCKIVKAFSHQGLQIHDIFPEENFMLKISRAGRGVKTTKLLFRMGLHIKDLRSSCDSMGYNASVYNILKNAVNHNCFTILKILYDQGFSVQDFRRNNNYALCAASKNGNLRIVKFLIQKVGLTIRDIRSRKNTALWEASSNGHLNVVAFLIKQGLGLDDFAGIPKTHAHIVDYVQTQIGNF